MYTFTLRTHGAGWCDGVRAGLAFERFTPTGPLALLPEDDHHGLVWTAPPGMVDALLALPDPVFLQRLEAAFEPRCSGFRRVGPRRAFALALEFAEPAVGTRCVVIGNAAQALHPVAGQGFNLGLRDAWELGRILIDTPRAAIGERPMLQRHARHRRRPEPW